MELKKAYISGTGFYVPEKVLTNHDLEKMVDTNDEWIMTRTGIKERRICADDESTSTMGAEAAKMAIKDAGLKPKDIELIITTTITPDQLCPSTSALIANILGIKNVGVFDIEAACSGYIYGLSLANQYIKTGEYKHVLVISSEALSRVVDWNDRSTCILFGDGAGATVISESTSDSEILSTFLSGDGSYHNLLYIPAGGSKLPPSEQTVKDKLHFLRMGGNETFKVAVTKLAEASEIILKKTNLKKSDINLLIPHQANLRIIKRVQKDLGLPDDKVYVNIHKYGNTSAATIPVALAEAVREGRIKKGDNILLTAFGGGFTWASTIIRW